MADIRLGNNNTTFKVGSTDVDAIYLGTTLVYSGGTPPTPQLKWVATYNGGTTASAECDASSAITSGEITLTDLVSVEIGNCVTSIGDSAFTNCVSLTSVTIGTSVTSIGDRGFFNCTSLTSVTINAVTPPELIYAGKITPFYNTNDCPIFVPSQSLNDYLSADGWDRYASRIQPIA